MIKDVTDSVQAVKNAADAIPALSTVVHAPRKLEHSRSQMAAKMRTLRKIKDTVNAKYWFPQKKLYWWLREVETVDCLAKELAAGRSSNPLKRFLYRCFPDFALVQDINTHCKDIDKLIQEGIKWDDELEKTDTERIVKFPTLVDIKKISTIEKNLKNILELLKDTVTNSIRVYGRSGTGKRELLKHVNNHEAVVDMFDIVLWCDIGNSTETTDIQLIIARRLGLKNKNDIESEISKVLKGARYLLLLDDVKADIKLDTIGIPVNTKGSKIVYTTSYRYIQPLSPFFAMNIKNLSEPDSWQLFENILINEKDTIENHEIGTIAHQVVEWCDGYFSLIKLVAENFKQKRSSQSWSDGLQMLKKGAEREDIYMQAMANILHCSYHGLKNNQKLCFLFSILYPEDSKIPIVCLFDCWRTLNLLEYDVPASRSNTEQNILEHLVAMGLLIEKGSNNQYVTVDKICRQAAMKILQEHEKFKCLVAEEALKKLKSDECKDTHWISLTNSEIDDLPNEVDCSNLTTLLLQNNSKLNPISRSFFKQMKDLLILDLRKTTSELVLMNMENLKVLYVNGCDMTELPLKVERLDHELEVLDIRDCIINEIPQDIENLKHLRRLMMSVRGSDTLDPIICKLTWLKELIIDVKSDVDEDSYMSWCNEVIGNIIQKIETLKELTTLQFYFKDEIVDVIQVMGDTLKIFVPKQSSLQHILKERNVHSRALQNLKVYIGIRMTTKLKFPTSFNRYGTFVLSSDTMVIEPVIEQVLLKVKTIIMVKNNSVVHLDPTAIPHIHHCLVQRCNKIETLIRTDGFLNLETLILSDCSELKALFLNNMVQTAMSIKHLEIRDCLAIEEINMSLNGGGDILPKLTTLVLHSLIMLTKICSDLEWRSLITLEIHECPMLAQIPLNVNNANNLRHIKVEKMWWENLQLDHEIKQKFKQYLN